MGAWRGCIVVWCTAALVLAAGCGDTNDDLTTPRNAGGTSGTGASGSGGVGASGAGGADGSGGASASGGASGSDGAAGSGGSGGGSGGASGSSGASGAGAGGSSGAQGSSGTAGTGSADAAIDSSQTDGTAGTGGNSDAGADAGVCRPCPKILPAAGSECSPCSRPTVCTYNGCGQPNNAIVTATCDASSGTWVLKSDPCNSFQCGAPPGGRRCESNQICVLPGATCVDNPCQDQPFSCSCAQSACPGAGYRCLEQGDRTIYCNCLTC